MTFEKPISKHYKFTEYQQLHYSWLSKSKIIFREEELAHAPEACQPEWSLSLGTWAKS